MPDQVFDELTECVTRVEKIEPTIWSYTARLQPGTPTDSSELLGSNDNGSEERSRVYLVFNSLLIRGTTHWDLKALYPEVPEVEDEISVRRSYTIAKYWQDIYGLDAEIANCTSPCQGPTETKVDHLIQFCLGLLTVFMLVDPQSSLPNISIPFFSRSRQIPLRAH